VHSLILTSQKQSRGAPVMWEKKLKLKRGILRFYQTIARETVNKI
jgi:hypothetical protein